ncbi:hypothetical protein KEM56_005846 [Ascosphaera pollenicola]|nr:hypothetical protein KEM56_005846 [Ascosphaera pollenicola]
MSFKNVAYFVNWDVNVSTSFLTDSWADIEKHYPGDSWNDVGNNVYGCVKQLFLLKQKNRKLKLLLSIGGWTYSQNPNFSTLASSESGRQRFADTATKLILDLGMDGIDVDWEYPQSDQEAANFVLLLQKCRQTLDQAAGSDRKFYLTIACPAGPSNYEKLHLKEMTPYLDFYNLMAYDYAGSWSTVASHQANIYPSSSDPNSTPFSTEAALDYYINTGGVPPEKMILGMPLYGRAFGNTDGPGAPYQGSGEGGSWEAGIWDYKVLPQPGAEEHIDKEIGASWSYDPSRRVMVTYDTVASVDEKTEYIKRRGLGGAMWWETSGDRDPVNGRKENGSLIGAFVEDVSGVDALDQTENALIYPESQYDNLKNGFPDN